MTDAQRATPGTHQAPIEPWAVFAARWARLGPPLRPCPEDLQRLQAAWLASLPHALPARPIDVLSLGVTPEFAHFPWAEQTRLRAIDGSKEMIHSVWPGDTPDRQAVLGDWRQMPFADASFDLIVCDAGLPLFVEMPSLTALGHELRRVLRPDGRVAMRHFVRTASAESASDLVTAVAAGQVRNFHELKLRLLLALDAETSGLGVCLGDAWDHFQRLFPDRVSLAQRFGCDLQTIATVDAYRERDARYTYRSLAELAQVFEAFRLAEGPPGHYPFAACCPVFSLTPIP